MTIAIKLLPSERDALKTLARNERREMRAQAAMLIRNELEKRGLLPTAAPPMTPGPARADKLEEVTQ